MRRAGLLAAGFVLGALGALAQNAPAAGSYTVSGVVLSATTGAPLDRAEVMLSTAGEQETQVAETVTGEGGFFRFDHLDAGKYALAASRRGYISSRYQEHEGGYSTAIVTGPNLVSENLRFDLYPMAVIGGTITDDNGDPVGSARVTLYRQQQDGGKTKVVEANADTTDDDGTYEFDRLHAGTYYIGVSAKPWYAFHPPQRMSQDGTPLPDQARSPLDVAYPMTFYANATDSGSATPVQISAGDHPEIDVTLHVVPAVRLEIRIPKADARRGISIPQISQDAFGLEQFQPLRDLMMYTVGDQTVVGVGTVAPGHYTLRDFGDNGANSTSSIDLNGDRTLDLGGPASTTDVSGKLEMATGAPLPHVTMLQLRPAGGGGAASAAASADGSFDLRAVAPGEYTVQVNTSNGSLDIVQMAASGAAVHGHRIVVGSDPVLLAAEVSSGSVFVSGFARRDGKGLGGALVLLVPEHPQDEDDLFRRDQSDSDGSFTLNRVVPGNYTLVAIANGWSLEWGRPEVIAPYLARGVKLHITGQPSHLDLSSPAEVQ